VTSAVLTSAVAGVLEVGAEAARLVSLSPLRRRTVVVVGVDEVVVDVHSG